MSRRYVWVVTRGVVVLGVFESFEVVRTKGLVLPSYWSEVDSGERWRTLDGYEAQRFEVVA